MALDSLTNPRSPRSPIRGAVAPARAARGGLVALAVLLAVAGGTPVPAAASDPKSAEVDAAVERLRRYAKDPFEQRQRLTALRTLGRVGGPAAVEAVLAVLDDPFAHVRDHAASALGEMVAGPAAQASSSRLVSAGLASRSGSVRQASATALARGSAPVAVPALVAALSKESDPAVVEALARSLAVLGDPSAVPALLRASTQRRPVAAGAALRAAGALIGERDAGETATAARAALAFRLGDPAALVRVGAIDGLVAADPRALSARAESLVRDAAPEPRIALAEALPRLAEVDRGRAFGALSRLLADPSWRVRAAACEAAVGVWDKEVLPLLIERLRVERGRLVRDVVLALERLTDASVGTDADLWASWWAARGPTLVLPAKPPPDRHGRVRRKARRAAGSEPARDRTTAAFFRLPIHSDRLAFLLDFSGSMRDAAGADPTTSKADVARAEFARVVAALPGTTRFDLFVHRYPGAFPPAPDFTRAFGALTPASAASARRAAAWLARETPAGFGAFFDGLVGAASDDEVDTIVLLSDGVPSMGTYDRGPRVVEEWVRFNRFRCVAVDTILVGSKGTDRAFMAELAEASYGRSETN